MFIRMVLIRAVFAGTVRIRAMIVRAVLFGAVFVGAMRIRAMIVGVVLVRAMRIRPMIVRAVFFGAPIRSRLRKLLYSSHLGLTSRVALVDARGIRRLLVQRHNRA
jgi:hypothetical protein